MLTQIEIQSRSDVVGLEETSETEVQLCGGVPTTK